MLSFAVLILKLSNSESLFEFYFLLSCCAEILDSKKGSVGSESFLISPSANGGILELFWPPSFRLSEGLADDLSYSFNYDKGPRFFCLFLASVSFVYL